MAADGISGVHTEGIMNFLLNEAKRHVRVMKSLVGLPGRKPGIDPLLRRRLLAISTGLYWMEMCIRDRSVF